MLKEIIKKTRIVATIGPASESVLMLEELINSGLNVARMNFSHGDHKEHTARLENIRMAMKNTGKDIAILQDLGGVKIRIGDFANKQIVLKKGVKFNISTKLCEGSESCVFINYEKLPKEVEIGQEILIDDGTKKLIVTNTTETEIETEVIVGGMIRSRRGVNVPGARLSCSALTSKDKNDAIEFGIKNDVDFIALSFVRSAKDIEDLREILVEKKSTAKIVAKIETPEAIENLDKIIAATDVVMVARGDLAVEMPAEDVPHLQKMIIKKCNIVGKPVIVATQMLESMIKVPTPTRAEVTDVTNAILDGADAVMLSAETAVGDNPIEVIQTMANIARRTEKDMLGREIDDDEEHARRTVNAISHSAIQIAREIDAVAIVTLTESGYSARKIARYQPTQPIITLTPHEKTHLQLQLSFGCNSYIFKNSKTVEETVSRATEFIRKEKLAKKGERIVIVAGVPFGKSGSTNMIIVERV